MVRPRGSSVTSAIESFFADLADREYEPLVRSASGTIRFDIVDGAGVEHWYVTMQSGDVDVSHRSSKADAVVRLDRRDFDGMVRGTVNAMAAMLRGALEIEGDLGLVVLFQRLFPSPPPGASRD